MSDSLYFLSKHCFVCKSGSYWIILNTDEDKYLCVAHSSLTMLNRHLYGWRHPVGTASDADPDTEHAVALLESLVAGRIITNNPTEGKPFVEVEVPPCHKSIDRLRTPPPGKTSLLRVIRFIVSCGKVDLQLRTAGLSRALKAIDKRRRKLATVAPGLHSTDCSSIIAIFEKLRPFYPRPYLCLFDSLALLEFLALHSIFPRIVFGIIAEPFRAHCWLQDGDVLLNDNVERIDRYQAILSM